MGVFAQSAGNRSQPISGVYKEAAMMINMDCGPGFVNSSVVVRSPEGAAVVVRARYAPITLVTLVLGLGVMVQVL